MRWNGWFLGENAARDQQCDAQHVGRTTSQPTHVGEPTRATQSIPPALRRKVMRRDHGRCVVPGCLHATFVDLHHIERRADGGRNDENNLIVLCSAHHRAQHRGQLCITGDVGTGLFFRRADGAGYGGTNSAHSVDVSERAFRGLRGMGVGEKEARRALERVRGSADAANTESRSDVRSLLRQALAMLVSF